MNTVLKKLQKYWLYYTAIICISIISSLFVSFTTPTIFRSSSFLSLGTTDREFTNTFFNFEASDNFTETLIGWLRNPNFIQRINANTPNQVSNINFKKVEKLNLSITFETKTNTNLEKTYQSVKENLQSEITSYNQVNNSKFNAKIDEFQTIEVKPNLLINLIASIFIAVTVSTLLTIIYESSKDYLIAQISLNTITENVLKCNLKRLKELSATLEKTQLVNLTSHSKLPIKTIDLKNFNPNENCILICEISYSNLSDIKLIKSLSLNNFSIILI